MNQGTPVLPPLRVRRTKSANYLYTYDHKWIPATKDPEGKVIKKGYTDISNKKIVGKLVGVDNTSFAVFYDEFLEQYPELRYYTAFRAKDHSWEFKKNSELDCETPVDKTVIDHLGDKLNYADTDEGKGLKSADDSKTGASPADIVASKSFEAGRTILDKRPERSRKRSKELISTVHVGDIALMEDIAQATGMTAALQKTVKKICSSSEKKYSAQEIRDIVCTLECFVIYIAITGQSTYEGFEDFVRSHAVKDEAARCSSHVVEFSHLIDQSFADLLQKNFIQIYRSLSKGKLSKRGLCICIDGTTGVLSNADNMLAPQGLNTDKTSEHQINVQMVVDSATGGLPLFIDTFDGRSNDIETYKHIMGRASQYSLSFDDLVVVCDSSSSSSENYADSFGQETKFLMNCPITPDSIATKMIDAAIADGVALNTTWLRHKMLSLTSDRVHYWSCKEDVRYDSSPVEVNRASQRDCSHITYHVFYNQDISNRECASLDNRIISTFRKLDKGEPLDTTEIALLKKCSNFNENKYVPGSRLKSKPKLDHARYSELSKYFGFRVLVTNDNDLTSEDALEYDLSRSSAESTIHINEQELDSNTTQVMSNTSFVSKLTLQYLAAILKCSLAHRTACARNSNFRKHSDVLRSSQSVLDTFSTVYAEKYEAGYVIEPIDYKLLRAFESMGVTLPESVISLAKQQESLYGEDDDDDDDEFNEDFDEIIILG